MNGDTFSTKRNIIYIIGLYTSDSRMTFQTLSDGEHGFDVGGQIRFNKWSHILLIKEMKTAKLLCDLFRGL